MQVSKRGNSSIVMIPVVIVDAFDLHEGIFYDAYDLDERGLCRLFCSNYCCKCLFVAGFICKLLVLCKVCTLRSALYQIQTFKTGDICNMRSYLQQNWQEMCQLQ